MYISASNPTCSFYLEYLFQVSFFFLFLDMCKLLVPKNFIITSWHWDPTWLPGLAVAFTETSSIKREDKKTKATTLFIHLVPNTHTVELKANFFNHMNVQLCNCNRPLPLLSVFYNEIDDYRGGWKRKRRGGKRLVDSVVMWMRFQSCSPGREQLAEPASFLCQFPLSRSLKSHTYSIHKISSMFGFDRKSKTKEQKKKDNSS